LLEDFKKGDAIRVNDGPFQGLDGLVDEVFPDKGQVRVIVTIYGRPTPIVLENWLIELI
jgi:transcriptional antiterminator NusG